MANRAYLLNTAFLTSDPYLVDARRQEGNDYIEVHGPGYRVPLIWLCLFRPEDLKPVVIPIDDEDDEEDENSEPIHLPSTTVAQAIRNLEQAWPLFPQLTGETRLARLYWEKAMAWLRLLPLPYLTLNLKELFDLTGEDRAGLEGALAGNASALPELINQTGYERGVAPYPPDVLQNVPGPFHDKRRLENAILLDVLDYGYWWRADDNARDEPLTLPPSPGRHDLRTVHDHVTTLIRGRDRDAHAVYGFTPAAVTGRHELKMLLSADSDRLRDKMIADRRLRAALDGFIGDTLQTICNAHGFEWRGFVIESSASLRRQFKDANEWVKLAATP